VLRLWRLGRRKWAITSIFTSVTIPPVLFIHIFIKYRNFFIDGTTAPSGPGLPHYRGFTITPTFHSQKDSFGQVISPTQRPIFDNTQHSQETEIHSPAGFESATPGRERPQADALGRGYIGARIDTAQQTNICLGIHRRYVWLHLIRHVCPDL